MGAMQCCRYASAGGRDRCCICHDVGAEQIKVHAFVQGSISAAESRSIGSKERTTPQKDHQVFIMISSKETR
jgi:hypothetical protein